MVNPISEGFGFHKQSLALRQQRQEILASNIANADTPGYKARDLEFSKALTNAMGGGNRLPNTKLTLTSDRHIPASASGVDTGSMLYRKPIQPSLDGNTVDMDVERVAFADNTMRYQTELAVVSQRIKSLVSVLQSA